MAVTRGPAPAGAGSRTRQQSPELGLLSEIVVCSLCLLSRCGWRELRREDHQIVHSEMDGLRIERFGRLLRPRRVASASGTGERIENETGQRRDRASERAQEVVAVEPRLLARARTGDLDAFVQLIG